MSIVIYKIPVCPFCQRIQILLELKNITDLVRFETVDITKPRDAEILKLTGGSTALPVMKLEDGRALKESLVLLNYLEDLVPSPQVKQSNPYKRAIENLLVTFEGKFAAAGYTLVMNQDKECRETLTKKYLDICADINSFLVKHSSGSSPFLFDDFGWAEVVFAPFFRRFVFLKYYENFVLPDTEEYSRFKVWEEACLHHPSAQQNSDEEIIKLYYDYSRGKGNGALVEGRSISSFTFNPPWRDRPMPPPGKYNTSATDAELGLEIDI